MEQGETLENCVKREVAEESGYQIEPLMYLGSTRRTFYEAASQRSFDKTTHYFLCELLDDSVQAMDGEHERAEWLPAAEAMHRLNERLPDHREADMIERGIEWLMSGSGKTL